MLLTSAVISGLGLGSMYGLIALGFHITYVVSNTVNFAQGSAMMLGAVLGYTFGVKYGWPMPPGGVPRAAGSACRAAQHPPRQDAAGGGAKSRCGAVDGHQCPSHRGDLLCAVHRV